MATKELVRPKQMRGFALKPKAGPGIPKGYKMPATLERQAARQIFMEEMRPVFRDVIRAQVELACGIAVIDRTDPDGERIFDRPPDASAAKHLIEQVMGKATEHIDLTTNGKDIPQPIINIARAKPVQGPIVDASLS